MYLTDIIMIVSVIILSESKEAYQSALYQYQFDNISRKNISKPVDKVHRRIKVFDGHYCIICFLWHIRR